MSIEEVAIRLTELTLAKVEGYTSATVVADVYQQILDYISEGERNDQVREESN